MRRVVGLRPTKTTLSQPAKAKRRSWQKAPRGFLRVHWGGSPNRVFTNTRSRSSSRAQEARNGSDSSKAQTKKAKDTEKSSKPTSASGAKADDDKHRATKKKHSKSEAQVRSPSQKHSESEGLGPVPTFRDYPFTMDEISSGTCDQRKLVPLKSHDIKYQGDMRYPCLACSRRTNYQTGLLLR